MAYQLVFGSNPVDLFVRDDKDGDLPSAQDTPLWGQFTNQQKLRMMAQAAALKEVAYSKLRRLLAYDASLNSSDVKIGDPLLLY